VGLKKDMLYPRNVRYDVKVISTLYAFHMELERIFGNFDARPPTYLIHFKWTFHVDISTPLKKKVVAIHQPLQIDLNALQPTECILNGK